MGLDGTAGIQGFNSIPLIQFNSLFNVVLSFHSFRISIFLISIDTLTNARANNTHTHNRSPPPSYVHPPTTLHIPAIHTKMQACKHSRKQGLLTLAEADLESVC